MIPNDKKDMRIQQQPVAPVRAVYDTYFGQTIVDPYRWMEADQEPEAQLWLREQAAYTEAFLNEHTARSTFLSRVSTLSAAATRISAPRQAGNCVFYLKREADEQLDMLVVRTGSDGPEQVLIDPNGIQGDASTAIDWYIPSPDGQRVVYGVSQGGSEDSTLHVVEVEGAVIHDLAIPHCRLGFVSWLDDQQSFLYLRFPELLVDAPLGDYYLDSCSLLHRLGTDPRVDPVILGRGLHPELLLAREDLPIVVATPHSPWLLGVIRHGVQNEITIYVARREVLTDPATYPWTGIADVSAMVTDWAIHGETIYLLTQAPRSQVIAASLAHPELTQPTVVVPASEVVIEEICIAGNTLVLREFSGGLGQIRQMHLPSGTLTPVPLPIAGTILSWWVSATSSEILLQLTSWTEAPRVFHYDVITTILTSLDWSATGNLDVRDLETHEVFAPGKDGTLIPLSIIHRRGLKLDGTNPTLLFGYGAYGISASPRFIPTMLAWYERGGVYAIAHIRGGGEYGPAWHHAGRLQTKQTTIDDFIACAEYLIDQHYTSPRCLAGEGVSAGGIPVGGALVQRPELWGAMLLIVALNNPLRSEFSPSGPPNIPEFGSVSTEAGFASLYAIDTYTQVQDGVMYPAVLLAVGVNDPRVSAWESMKLAARLQAATASGQPVLLRVDFEAGHGAGAMKRQSDAERADVLAFLAHQFGMV